MENMNTNKNGRQVILTSIRITSWDMITGLPAGVLIFMGTVLLSTVLSRYSRLPEIAPLFILLFMSIMVGTLAGITRLQQGPATALSAGFIAAGILSYLWLSARPGDEFNRLVVGPIGISSVILFSPIGGWLGAKLRKAI